ncbi:oxidoreductase [Actinomadura fibrosa]|uniref:Oxidoreductase n=1 Tax=Actinomadura fibrosa TaxID=111802 RepID=A0ABW2XQR4_9ACTN|nr:oxidoreductase [Actinomadura fibrosa]
MAETSEGRVWLVTGTSSGFGRALAEAVVARGDRLVAAVRRPESNDDLAARAPDRVRVVRADVTRPEDVRAAVRVATREFGRIDAVVNNAGFGLLGGVEEVTDEQIRAQLEVNTFGVFDVTRAVLPVLRAQRSGHIFMISSVAGQLGAPGLAWYDASKFAVEGFSEALAAEVAPIGVKVTIIEPGNFRTHWAGASMATAAAPIADYAPSIDPVRELFAGLDGAQPGDPARAAEVIVGLLDAPDPPLRLVLGGDALELIQGKLSRQTAEMDAWREVTYSTDFDAARPVR